jgi:fumarylacetoacetase
VSALDVTHDPALRSWVSSAADGSDFGLQNLPFGVVALPGESPHGVVRIGDEVLDLAALAGTGLLDGEALTAARAAGEQSLNALFALGAGPRRALRLALHGLLVEGSPAQGQVMPLLTPVADVDVLLPAVIGDYTDFYVGIHHATNVGSIFRPDNPLLPNYKWVPIGYHGRASSIGVSCSTVVRPLGQTKQPNADTPSFGPTDRLDIELELGIWIGPGNDLGAPIGIDDAEDHIAGYCLLDDWSARDIQAWEYQPLGPFLSKSFATTVSAWVVTPEALAPYRLPWSRPDADPAPLPYLDSSTHRDACGFEIDLEVLLATAQMRAAGEEPVLVSSSSTRHMYWSVAQLVAHHTSNGCNLRPGDLFGSGTLSGPTPGSEGSFLELSRGGTEPFALPNGEKRTFLLDGDEVVLRARAHRDGAAPVGFGECRAVIAPARGGPA